MRNISIGKIEQLTTTEALANGLTIQKNKYKYTEERHFDDCLGLTPKEKAVWVLYTLNWRIEDIMEALKISKSGLYLILERIDIQQVNQ